MAEITYHFRNIDDREEERHKSGQVEQASSNTSYISPYETINGFEGGQFQMLINLQEPAQSSGIAISPSVKKDGSSATTAATDDGSVQNISSATGSGFDTSAPTLQLISAEEISISAPVIDSSGDQSSAIINDQYNSSTLSAAMQADISSATTGAADYGSVLNISSATGSGPDISAPAVELIGAEEISIPAPVTDSSSNQSNAIINDRYNISTLSPAEQANGSSATTALADKVSAQDASSGARSGPDTSSSIIQLIGTEFVRGEGRSLAVASSNLPAGAEDRTITAWIQRSAPVYGDADVLISQGYINGYSKSDVMLNWANIDGSIAFDFQIGAVYTDATNINDGKPHFLALSFNRSEGVKIWLDGNQLETHSWNNFNPASVWTAQTGEISFGGQAGTIGGYGDQTYYSGRLGEARVYNTVLGDREIQSLYADKAISSSPVVKQFSGQVPNINFLTDYPEVPKQSELNINDTIDHSGNFNTIYGDALTEHYGDDSINITGNNNGLFGDNHELNENAVGGHDSLKVGGNNNTLYGDAENMLENSTGGNDDLVVVGTNNRAVGDANRVSQNALGGNDVISAQGDANYLYGDVADIYAYNNGSVAFGNDTLIADGLDNYLFGDFAGSDSIVRNFSVSYGNDILTSKGSNKLIGDSQFLDKSERGGDDTLTATGYGNALFGDGYSINGNAAGGNDVLTATGSYNTLFGDAVNLNDNSAGGNDVLISSGNFNTLYGDALSLNGNSAGGTDTLIISSGTDYLYGDAVYLAPGAVGRADIFKFLQGTGDHYVMDFHAAEGDKIDLSAYGFTNMNDFAVFIEGSEVLMSPQGSLTNYAGGALVSLGDGNNIHIQGIAPTALNNSHFIWASNSTNSPSQ